jgi:hypothetical protein
MFCGETLPKDKGGIKEWVKKLGKLLANLAGKAAAALPGIIGSIVSWLLSATGNIVNWFANNLWTLIVLEEVHKEVFKEKDKHEDTKIKIIVGSIVIGIVSLFIYEIY